MKRSAHMRTTKTTIPCRMRMAAIAVALAVAMAACEDLTTPTTPNTEPPSDSPAASKQPTCADRTIRLLDRSGSGVHGAIVDDTLHMGGESAPATCQETADLSLLAGSSMPDAQVAESQYYLIVIHYPNRNRLYVIRRTARTTCVVDTNDVCVAIVSGLPDGFEVSDLPDDAPPIIPGGRDAPPEQPGTDTKPDAVENPYPRNGKTGVTVEPLLSWAASPQAASYDLYYGTTKELAGTPITTENTAVTIPRPGAADQRLAGDTTYYWRVDARNDAGATRGTLWSFTTGAAVPNVAGIYEGNTTATYETRTAEGDVVRREFRTRDRIKVWQVSASKLVFFVGTILEVLLGGDRSVRAWIVEACALSPDGMCRPCNLYQNENDSFVCSDPELRGITRSTTFKGSQLSYRAVAEGVQQPRSGELSLGSSTRLVGTYEKVADDPGLLPMPTAPTADPPTPAPTPDPAPPPVPPSRTATCVDSAIRLLDRGAGIHGAIIADTLHMGGATAPATCSELAALAAAGSPIPGGREAQVQQSQYYLMVIRYPGGNRLYVVSRRSDGSGCVVDTNDRCIAQVTDLPDDFDPSDLPNEVPSIIPAGRPAPPTVSPPPAGGDTPPLPPATTAPGSASNPHPRNGATGVTVAPLLSWAASSRAFSYDLYYGTTRNLASDATLINTLNTTVTITRRLAGDTTYYWRVDAKNNVGATRGTVWSFTTGAD